MSLWDVIPYPGPDPNRHIRVLPIPLVPHSVAFIMVVSTTVLLLFFLKVGGIGDIWTGVDNCEHLLVISLNVDCNKQFSKCGSDYNWLSLTSAFRAAFKHCSHYVYATVQHISMLWVHGDISFVTELFDYQGTVQLAVSYAAVLKFHTATNRLLYSTWCNVRIQLRRSRLCCIIQLFSKASISYILLVSEDWRRPWLSFKSHCSVPEADGGIDKHMWGCYARLFCHCLVCTSTSLHVPGPLNWLNHPDLTSVCMWSGAWHTAVLFLQGWSVKIIGMDNRKCNHPLLQYFWLAEILG